MSEVNKRLMLCLIAVSIALTALQVSTLSNSVAIALVTLLSVAAAFLIRERFDSGERAPVSIGAFYIIVVTLYGAYPLIVYVVLGGSYTPLNDNRLFSIQPGPDAVSRLAWYYIAYAAAFIAGYILVKPQRLLRHPVVVAASNKSVLWAVVLVFVVLRLAILAADVSLAAPVEDYLSWYLRYRHLPLLLQQLLGHANGILSVLSIAVVVAACQDWRRLRWLVFLWVGLEATDLVVGLGSRTDVVLLVLTVVVSYHFLVRPLSARSAIGGGVLLILAFIAIGAMRALSQGSLLQFGVEILATTNEFESLFANALDIDQLLAAGRVDSSALSVAVYLGDIIGLVPQQLIPFEKINLSRWYVESFYQSYADAGGGLVFGAIAESLMGLGPADLLWRGAVTGLVFGWLDRQAHHHRLSFWRFVFYIWVLVTCYVTFRVSMLALLPLFVYRFLPVVIVVSVLAELLRISGGRVLNARSKPGTLGNQLQDSAAI